MCDWQALRPEDFFEQRLLGDGSNTTYTQFPDPYMSSCDLQTTSRYISRFPPDAVVTSVVETVKVDWLWKRFFPHRSPDSGSP